MASPEVAELLFEIASPVRLGILEAVAERPLKHAAIARRLAITGSETTRHLNRLSASGLVTKDGRGEYSPTPLGTALRAGLPFLEFVQARRAYLRTHSVAALEPRFVARMGELRAATLVQGTYPVVAAQESALQAVRRRIWVVSELRFDRAIPLFREKTQHGTDVRVVRSHAHLEAEKRDDRDVLRNFPVRSLPTVPVFLAVLDDQAGLCLPTGDGAGDLTSMLLVTDPVGLRWAEELFLSFWERAVPWWTPAGPALGSPPEPARRGSARFTPPRGPRR
ncbi:MAG TPA: helix-turn-helix domain-containing protein [Thermoplasmata archaeon]|jgi:predicted transcriptional regulator|nr:helix-turn-helix domain-containing protein [Thermoplasmata archaeon]